MKNQLPPNDFGKNMTVENCRSIRINDVLRLIHPLTKKALIESQLKIQGVDVSLATSTTRFGGTRFWIQCPLCHKRKGVLYQHSADGRVGCRKCFRLPYAKQRYKGMVESFFDQPEE